MRPHLLHLVTILCLLLSACRLAPPIIARVDQDQKTLTQSHDLQNMTPDQEAYAAEDRPHDASIPSASPSMPSGTKSDLFPRGYVVLKFEILLAQLPDLESVFKSLISAQIRADFRIYSDLVTNPAVHIIMLANQGEALIWRPEDEVNALRLRLNQRDTTSLKEALPQLAPLRTNHSLRFELSYGKITNPLAQKMMNETIQKTMNTPGAVSSQDISSLRWLAQNTSTTNETQHISFTLMLPKNCAAASNSCSGSLKGGTWIIAERRDNTIDDDFLSNYQMIEGRVVRKSTRAPYGGLVVKMMLRHERLPNDLFQSACLQRLTASSPSLLSGYKSSMVGLCKVPEMSDEDQESIQSVLGAIDALLSEPRENIEPRALLYTNARQKHLEHCNSTSSTLPPDSGFCQNVSKLLERVEDAEVLRAIAEGLKKFQSEYSQLGNIKQEDPCKAYHEMHNIENLAATNFTAHAGVLNYKCTVLPDDELMFRCSSFPNTANTINTQRRVRQQLANRCIIKRAVEALDQSDLHAGVAESLKAIVALGVGNDAATRLHIEATVNTLPSKADVPMVVKAVEEIVNPGRQLPADSWWNAVIGHLPERLQQAIDNQKETQDTCTLLVELGKTQELVAQLRNLLPSANNGQKMLANSQLQRWRNLLADLTLEESKLHGESLMRTLLHHTGTGYTGNSRAKTANNNLQQLHNEMSDLVRELSAPQPPPPSIPSVVGSSPPSA